MVELSINGHTTSAPVGASLFDCAEKIGVRVPTSCLKNGKCKECVVEIAEGMELSLIHICKPCCFDAC